ncbi:O-antigen ligase family protein [Vibrio lentus]|uniref:Polymerase n=1 Tax=Vibrio lentus TaxID=136468 RepID=A0AA44VRQ3_9VIBR|nr:O-antigen ligase family protein [Vibrio lentus]MCB5358435.1 O-antigen ligase family protein [Vibrio lentus]MCB5448903.1 O-antigen ligase family protein [Vibrio lentus]MCB5460790.1 O-antigen ligase family protein [Vibrio lentus]MCC4795165.1 O-antigen ligase family protein [Vibrio lentus]MCC4853324.1 O-antigen ligase family protein [Vibrio lentus]
MRLNNFSFYSLLTLLIWLPIPLGSNRIWAWSIAGIWVGVTLLTTMFSYRSHWQAFPWPRLNKFKWLLLPIALFQLWGALQLMPLSQPALASLSPMAAKTYSQLNELTNVQGIGQVSVDPFSTYTSLVKGLIYMLFTLLSIVLIDSKKRIQWVLSALLFSGCLQAVYGAMVLLFGFEFSPIFGIRLPDVATGSFIYKNHLANYMMMCLCLGAGLLVSQLHVTPSGSWHTRIQRWVSGIISNKMIVRCGLIMMVIALVMTRSRMGNTAFFAATLTGGFTALIFYNKKPRALVALVISLVLIDTVIVGSLFGLAKVKDRLEQTALTKETRDEVVEWGSLMVEQAPITGYGLGSFHSTFPKFSLANIGYYDHAHNEYLQFAVEAGIPMTLMLGGMCIVALIKAVQTMRKRRSKTMKGTALGCYMAIVGMLIHIAVDFNLQPSANAMTFLMVLVLVGVTSVLPSNPRRTSSHGRVPSHSYSQQKASDV